MQKHLMLDLETMGNGSDAAIVSIGAAVFSVDEGITNKFYSLVDLQSCLDNGLKVTGSTIMWWLGQSESARKALTATQAQDLPSALIAFTRFVKSVNPDGKIQVWGNGATFDNVILRNAYHAIGIAVPWEFWNDRCYRTLRAQNTSVKVPDRGGVHHNALDDAVYQAECAILYLKGDSK